MRELAQRFMALFDGAERGYGIYQVTGAKGADGKRVGNAVTKHDPVTVELWESHLSGKTGAGIGIIPIKEDSTCMWGAIDLDVYGTFDHKKMAQTLQKNKLPLVPCRSKSGGCHLYAFFKQPIGADIVQGKLAEIAAFLGHGGSEIFPKQKKILVERGDKGSWINMPYFNGVKEMRYAVKIDGEAMSPEEFLQYADTVKVDEEQFSQPLVKQQEDLIDGPPCLQHLIQIGGISEGARNNGLFNMAVYLRKAHPDSWEDKLEEYNHKYIDPPLKSSEIQGTVKSAKKRDYAYTCSKPPIAPHCNSAVCRTRKFGISDGAGQSFPNLGPLSKLEVRPPIWFWDVEGHRIELTTSELQDPNVFQRKCMEVLNMMPPVPTKVVWHRIVQTAMENVAVIEAPEDASPEGQFFEHLDKFLSGKAKAQVLEEVIQGKPYEDDEFVYFRLVDLERYLDTVRFREFATNKLASLIRDRGAKHQFANFKGKGTNYWKMPKAKIGQQTEQFEIPDSVKKGEDAF